MRTLSPPPPKRNTGGRRKREVGSQFRKEAIGMLGKGPFRVQCMGLGVGGGAHEAPQERAKSVLD